MKIAAIALLVGSVAAANSGALRVHSLAHSSMVAPDINVCFGEEKCPCIGWHNVEGESPLTLKGKTSIYPVSLGHCDAHDNGRRPDSCMHADEKPGKDKGWCAERWCYVDPCNCELPDGQVPVISNDRPMATYQGKTLFFSSATCGNADTFTADAHKEACVNQKQQWDCQKLDKCAWDGKRCAGKEVLGACSQKLHGFTWGMAGCRCIGISGLLGTMKVNTEPPVDYPADVGSTCQKWDDNRHPLCLGDGEKPDFCSQPFCYIDPASCNLAIPPKLSAMLKDAKNGGRSTYYSYATCGGVDHFTKKFNKEACVNKQTEKECKKSDKCAWGLDTVTNENRCLGKDLAGARMSGAMAATPLVAFVALALSLVF